MSEGIFMRAKMEVVRVEEHQNWTETKTHEVVFLRSVSHSGPRTPDGVDQDNSFTIFVPPAASFSACVTNPKLWGKFQIGSVFYVDFTPAL